MVIPPYADFSKTPKKVVALDSFDSVSRYDYFVVASLYGLSKDLPDRRSRNRGKSRTLRTLMTVNKVLRVLFTTSYDLFSLNITKIHIYRALLDSSTPRAFGVFRMVVSEG